MDSRLTLTVLGGFDLRIDSGQAVTLPRKTRAMLAYLAVQQDRSVSREAIGELLWSNRGREQVRHSLRQALAELRRAFCGADVVLSQDSTLRLADGVQSDVSLFLKLELNDDRNHLQEAVNSYAGCLLDGFPPISSDFDDWLMMTRRQLETRALELLARLAQLHTEAGDAAAALDVTERMFGIDPLREDIHRRLLEACAVAGRRADGLRHYGNIVDILRRELGVTPAKETRELAQRLRQEMDPFPQDNGGPSRTSEPGRFRLSVGPPIAVLPFHQISGTPIESHITHGLVADIICQLSGLRELSVISHGSTVGLSDPMLELRDAGRLLGVRYLVRGSIRRDDRNLRLTCELADAETGMVIWARSHDAGSLLTFDDQDRIVAQIVNTLAPRVREFELQRIRGKRPESLTVYEKTLLVRQYLSKLERDGFDLARRLIDEVIAEDPGYAEAYALDADWHGLFLSQGWSTNRRACVEAVERQTRLALSLDGDNVRALVFYAHRKSLHHREFLTAQHLFKRALDVSPSSAKAWLWSSYTYSYQAKTKEALRRIEQALTLSPCDRDIHEFYEAMNIAYYTEGDYRQAAEWGLRALSEGSVRRATYWWTAASLVGLGNLTKAREIANLGIQEMPGRRVRDVVANSPFESHERRGAYGMHLLAAGFPL